MSVRRQFETHFSEENLKSLYESIVALSSATGIDNLDHRSMQPVLDEQLAIISDKTLKGTYRFTKYKLKLVSKGRGKVPREISIPTIRDRIALRALCDFLAECFSDDVRFELPQKMIRNVKGKVLSGKYDGFIKLDVSNFYPTIRHKEILGRIRRKIRDKEIISFIEQAISTPTVIKSSKKDVRSLIGIPQGLSISNILAAIYLINIDKKLRNSSTISYSRYVDDIFILCDYKSVYDVTKDVIKDFRRIGLVVHDPLKSTEKSVIGKVGEKFDYLGYQFEGALIGPRPASIEKLKDSLVSIFTSYKHSKTKSIPFLTWRLNLRITGCVFQEQSKGWMFFFSEINDERVLHSLDRHVSKLSDRFGVKIRPKLFVRTFHEIKHARHETRYIPNFDTYTMDQMKAVLKDYFGKDLFGWADDEIRYEFRKKIDRQVRDLLTDVQGIGY